MDIVFDLAEIRQTELNEIWLSIRVDKDSVKEMRVFVSKMKDKKYIASLKQFFNKRTLDANGECWRLLQKLSEVIGDTTKEEVYRNIIRDKMEGFVFPIETERVDEFVRTWRSNGIGWVCDNLGENEVEGYTNMISYAGSSTYDTRQMWMLISEIVYQCKIYDIETKRPEEIKSLLEGWKK